MTRTTVSKSFRDLLLAELPGLAKNPAYWRLLGWMLFGRLTDNGGVLVTKEILAKLEGKAHQLRSRNYSGITFLEAFQRDVAPGLRWSEFEYAGGKAREITAFGLSETVLQALAHERATPAHQLKERVYLETGLKWSRPCQRNQRAEDRASAMVLLDKAGCIEVQRLMNYLNHLPANRFAKMLQHLPAAYEEARKLENARSRERALRLLRNIADQPQPLYGPTENGRTVRLFSTNESLCRLPRAVRKVLTQDWTSVDLKSAQLAIVSQLWGVPIVSALLQSGACVWAYLCEELGVPYTEQTKKGIKRMVYALVFGSGKRKHGAIDQAACECFPDQPDIVARFFSVPLIDGLYQARKVAEARVLANGGADDAFGNWITVPRDHYGQPSARSVLASQAQSYELRLLWPVIEEAMNTAAFDVTVYLFDGLCLAFKDSSKRARILDRLKDNVGRVAAELGMPTALEVEAMGDQPKPGPAPFALLVMPAVASCSLSRHSVRVFTALA